MNLGDEFFFSSSPCLAWSVSSLLLKFLSLWLLSLDALSCFDPAFDLD